MSSVKYADRSEQQIETLIRSYGDFCLKSFFQMPDPEKLKVKLIKLIHDKEEEIFKRHFGDLSPKDLIQACQIIDSKMKEKPQVLNSEVESNLKKAKKFKG